MKNLLAVAAAGALLVLGAIALVVANTGGPAVAQETGDVDPGVAAEPLTMLEDVLHDLVEDDVIEQHQADAILEAVRERRPVLPDRRGLRDGFRLPRGLFGDAEGFTDLFGMTPQELRNALTDGQSLAEIIEDPRAMVDGIVDRAAERLATAVEIGRITEEQAAEHLDRIRRRAEAFINGEFRHR